MTRWYIAILLYLIIVCLLLALRPAMMFKPDKDYRRWSMRRDADHSIFSVAIIFPLLAIVCYYISALYFVLI